MESSRCALKGNPLNGGLPSARSMLVFYWHHQETYVILSDDEETALVRELVPDVDERIRYMTSQKIRRAIEKQIFRYFGDFLRENPDAFRRRFVFRACVDEEARMLLPVFLDGYGRFIHRACVGHHAGLSDWEEVLDGFRYAGDSSPFYIALIERGRFPWSRLRVSGSISFPIDGVEKVAGSVDDFFVACASATLRFHRDYVRVAIR